MSKIDLQTATIVANNLTSLMNHYDLTPYGVEAGAGVEIHTIAKILRKTTNISTFTAKKLSNFFEITIDALFSSRPLKLKRPDNVPTIKQFYADNVLNPKFFISKQKENVVAQFLRTVLIYDPHLNEKKRSGIIAKHINNTYGKSFNPKTVAKELARMYEEELIDREDKTGKGSVFYYGLKSPIIDDN